MDEIDATAAELFDRAARLIGTSNEEVALKITEALSQHAGTAGHGRLKVSRFAVAKWRKGETEVPLKVLIAACWAGGYTLAQIVALEPQGDDDSAGAAGQGPGAVRLARAVGQTPSRQLHVKLRVIPGCLALFAALLALETASFDPQLWWHAAQAMAAQLARPQTVHASDTTAHPPTPAPPPTPASPGDESIGYQVLQVPDHPCVPAVGCGRAAIALAPTPTPTATPTPAPVSEPEPSPSPTPEPAPKHGPKLDPGLSPAVSPAPVPTVPESLPPLSAPHPPSAP